VQVLVLQINALNQQKLLRNVIQCQGDHPANYKGCSAYKILYNNKYPKPRVKDLTIPTPSPQKLSTPSISYAQVVQGVQSRPIIHNEHSQNIPVSVPSPQSTNNLDRLEKLIDRQSEQFKSLLSLLTLLVSKLHCDVK
jgi:hypothetical protein